MSEAETFEQEFRKICAAEGPLSQRLSDVTRIIRKYDTPFADAYDVLVSQLSSAGAGANAPKIGDAFPDFLLPDQSGRFVRLDDLLSQGGTVISFNRGYWCDYCDVELRAFADAHLEFSAVGARVAIVMPDRATFMKQVRNRTGNAFDVLSDVDNGLALELDLAIWLGDKVKELLMGIGINLEICQGNGAWFVPIPATFVLDKNGVIAARYVDPDFRNRMDIEDILDALKRS